MFHCLWLHGVYAVGVKPLAFLQALFYATFIFLFSSVGGIISENCLTEVINPIRSFIVFIKTFGNPAGGMEFNNGKQEGID
jgi:hypothetical protein